MPRAKLAIGSTCLPQVYVEREPRHHSLPKLQKFMSAVIAIIGVNQKIRDTRCSMMGDPFQQIGPFVSNGCDAENAQVPALLVFFIRYHSPPRCVTLACGRRRSQLDFWRNRPKFHLDHNTCFAKSTLPSYLHPLEMRPAPVHPAVISQVCALHRSKASALAWR